MHLPILDSVLSAIASHESWYTAIAIIVATFVHEDLTIIAVGVMAADGVIGIGVALPALYAGIVLGDIGLYGLGRLIATHRFSKRMASRNRLVAIKAWLDRRLIVGVFAVRFLPGLRLSAYTTYGFFAMPFYRFVVSVVLAASIWTTGLFYLSYEFGALTERWLGFWRWPTLIIALVVPLLLTQRILRSTVEANESEKEDESS